MLALLSNFESSGRDSMCLATGLSKCNLTACTVTAQSHKCKLIANTIYFHKLKACLVHRPPTSACV